MKKFFFSRPNKEILKKFWVSFLLFSLVVSQSFTYFAQYSVKAQDYVPQDQVLVKQDYVPTKSFVISSSTPLAWENPARAYVTDLSEDASAVGFTTANSAVLKVNSISPTSTSELTEILPVVSATPTIVSKNVVVTEPTSTTSASSLAEIIPDEAISAPATSSPSSIPAVLEIPGATETPTSSEVKTFAGEVEMSNILQGTATPALIVEAASPIIESSPDGSSLPAEQRNQTILPPGEPVALASSPVPFVQAASSTQPEIALTPSTSTSETVSSTPAKPFVPLLDLIDKELVSSSTSFSASTTVPSTVSSTSETVSTSPVSAPSLILPDLISAPALEYSGFNLALPNPDLATGTHPISLKVKLSLSSPTTMPGRLVLQYALSTSSFQSLTAFDISSALSNASHGGYYEAQLPLGLYPDIESVKLRLVYQTDAQSLGQYAGQDILLLDGISISAFYPDYTWDEEDLAVLKLPALTPEQFSHLEFFGPLMELFMPSDLSSNPITVGSKQKNPDLLPLRLLPLGVSTATPPNRAAETVTYPDAFVSTDLEYKLKDTGLKENIILKDQSHPGKFRYLANFDGYDPVQVSPSTIFLYQKGHKNQPLYKRYTLSAPIMTDAGGKTSDKLAFRLKGNLLTLTPDPVFLKDAAYPVVVDPTVELNVLNVSSFPVAGSYWTIDFTTVGTDTLTIAPGDQATIDDMDFSSLTCNGSTVSPNLLPNGVIQVPNWNCDNVGEVRFFDKKTGHHHMVFTFGSATQDAYNGANVYTGATGGAWETASNWSMGTVPVAADDVVINTAVTVNINSGTTVNSLTVGTSGGGQAAVLNFNYDASSTPLTTTGDLNVYSGASITQTAGSTSTVVSRVNLSIGGNAFIVGTINTSGKGYAIANGPGAGSITGRSVGASYGGSGGTGSAGDPSGTSTYGSLLAPVDLGSGGASGFCSGGAGGGSVKLFVTGTTTVSGTVSANGNNGSCGDAGAGSGGSVYLNTNILAGSGVISANGGNMNSSGGSGGGGRVAIYYTTDNSTTTPQAFGGSTRNTGHYGGAGTIFKKKASQTNGDLIIDNNNAGGTSDPTFGFTPLNATSTFDSLTVKNSGYLYLLVGSSTTATMTLVTNGLYDARSGTALTYTSLTWAGAMVYDSNGSFALLNQNQDLLIPTSSELTMNVATSSVSALRTYNNVTINGTLTHTANSSATTGVASLYKINWTVNGNLIVNSSGSVNINYAGYPVTAGPGSGTLTGRSVGASYGGSGGTGSAGDPSSSSTYGSIIAPIDLGSGGANGFCTGGSGGGAAQFIVTGTTTLSGSMTSLGANGSCGDAGAGSGGSIYLNTGGLSGAGSIIVNGGNMNSSGGSGGGGRLAVLYTTDMSTISYQAYGGNTKNGTRYGGAGTIYKKQAAANGDLIIDNNNSGGTTEISFGLTPITSTGTYDSLTVRNSGSVYLTASSATATAITLTNNGMYDAQQGTALNYTSLNWGTGMITDSNGSFAVIAQNQDLTVPTSSKLIFNVPNTTRTYNNLTVIGTLSHAYNSTATTGSQSLIKLNWQVNGNLNIPSTGLVDVIGRGFPVGQGPGAGYASLGGNNWSSAGQGVGGSYGGLGGYSDNGAGGLTTYGSLTQPTDLGSGGYLEGGCSAIHGGGAVIFNVTGTTTLSGTINATAAPKLSAGFCDIGGGSGGSVYLTTVGLIGNGTVQARGGDGHDYGSGGGGGRIAMYYTNDASSITYQVYGGQRPGPGGFGGSGTIFRKSSSQTYGDLIMNNNGQGGNDERILGRTPLGMSAADPMNFDSITATSSAYFYLASSTATSLSVTSTIITLSENGMYDALPTTTLAYSTLNWNTGMIRDTGGVFQVISQNQDLLVPTNSKLIFNIATSSASVLRTYNNLTVSGTLTHSYNTNATTGTLSLFKLNWQVNNDLTINSSGSINTIGRGYTGNQGPGLSTYNAGSSYGGLGGKNNSTVTATGGYGSLLQPVDLGSGGQIQNGCYEAGGGAVKFLVIGTTTVIGTISANGGPLTCWNPGGGTGGSIYLTTGILSGNGTISAIGSPGTNFAGGGGGGRIAVYYTTDNSSTSIVAYGGTAGSGALAGGAGTVYKKSTNQTYGDLILDNNNQGGTTIANFSRTQIAGPLVFDNFTLRNSAYLDATTTQAYSIYGNFSFNNSIASTTYVTLQLTASSPSTITQTGILPVNVPLVINASSSVSLASALTASSTLTITSGTFNANNNTSTYSGLVTINGGTYQASSLPQNFLTGLTQSSGTFTGGSGTVNINGNLNLSGGNFNPAGTTNITGNLNNAGATFLATSGTVTLIGSSQSVSGNNTFYNFTKTTAITDTLTFTASSTQIITNTMTLQGAVSNLLSLRSTASGTQWNINPQGARSVAYLDVKDSQNTNFMFINAYNSNSVDSGNNIKWAFFPATLTQSDYRFYQNGDVLQPTSPLALQNATTTIYSSTTPIRLRMNISVSNYYLPSPYQAFKLQVSTSTNANWLDVGSLPPVPTWWNGSWANRRKITFNNASSTVNLINFPVAVSLNPALNNIDYSKTKAGGADIRFVDADGVTPLNYEIEKWDAAATSTVWVKVPQIDATSSTDYIWMYYNNPQASDNSTTTGVWDSNYLFVQHLSEGPLVDAIHDSTSNALNASSTNLTSASAGQIGGALTFSGSSAYITEQNGFANLTGGLTISAWVYPTSLGAYTRILDFGNGQASNNILFSRNNTGNGLLYQVYNGATGGTQITTASGFENNQWKYVSVSENSGGGTLIYSNGSQLGSGTTTVPQNISRTLNFLGKSNWGADPYYQGKMDEVRVSNIVRTPSWIQAEYKTGSNQYNTYAAEEGAGGTLSSLATWQFYNNPSVASGTIISAALLSTSIIQGTYEESNPSVVNPFDVPVGQSIEYDFAVSPQNMLADIPYYFRMVQSNGAALNTYSNYPALLYTYVPNPFVPSNFQASADSASQISLSWSANGNASTTQYLVENLTSSTNSGWLYNTSAIFTGLSCGTIYDFTVKARNFVGVESTTVSVSTSTPACGPPSGAGGSGPPPLNSHGFCMVINGDANTTVSSSVTLDISTDATGITQMQISNSPVFDNVPKQAYNPEVTGWDLCGGKASCAAGTYIVYIKLYNSKDEVSPVISDSIDYAPVDPGTPVTVRFITDSAFSLGGNTDAAVGVSLSHATTVPASVDYAITGGTAILGVDYQFTPGTLTFPAGQTSANINFTVSSQTAGGTIIMALTNPMNANVVAPSIFTYTLAGNIPTSSQGSLIITSPGILSGNTPTQYTVKLSKAPTQDVFVSITTDGQTNVAPTSLTFTPANWNVPQPVALSLLSSSSATSSTISHQVASVDPNFRSFTQKLVVNISTAVVCPAGSTDPYCSYCYLHPEDPTCQPPKTFCELHPTDPTCNPGGVDCTVTPNDPACSLCVINPSDPKCVKAYCTLHPEDLKCQGICNINPSDPSCSFCSLYPTDPVCVIVDPICSLNPQDPICIFCTLKPNDPACLTYCQAHPADPICTMSKPYCDLHPEDPACKSDICKQNPYDPACLYCKLHPEDSNCQSNICKQNPLALECQFCSLYPQDKKCKGGLCDINPADPSCQTPFCDLHPEDPACKSDVCKANPNLPECAFCSLYPNDPSCVSDICKTNPADPSCPPTGKSFCELYPNDKKCKKDFCSLNPTDVLCKAGYCNEHPFDSACITQETKKTVEGVIDTAAAVIENSTEIAKISLDKLPGSTSTVESIGTLSTYVVAPAITAARLFVPAYGLIAGVPGAVDLWLWFMRLWYALLGALGFRRKRKIWGTVYDSATKQPLDPVVVSLIDIKTKQTVDQSITDMAGRYGFLDRIGTFTILAQKTNYLFPSKRISGRSDEIYDNLYYGETFTITNAGDSVVAPNIPMDPMGFDWNQKDKQRIMKLHPRLEHVKSIILSLLFYSGFALTLALALAMPSVLHYVSLVFYFLIILLSWILPSKRLWGRVYFLNSNFLLTGALLELTPPNLGVVMGRARIGEKGRFFLKSQPGKYILKIYSSASADKKLIGQLNVQVGKRGVLNGDFGIIDQPLSGLTD